MYRPTETEITYALEKLASAFRRSDKMCTVAYRLKELIEELIEDPNEENASTNLHEMSALADWLTEQPDQFEFHDAGSALRGEVDFGGDDPEPDEPTIAATESATDSTVAASHKLREEYESLLSGTASPLTYIDARDDMLEASETLAKIASIAGDENDGEAADWLMAKSAYYTASLITLARAFENAGRSKRAQTSVDTAA